MPSQPIMIGIDGTKHRPSLIPEPVRILGVPVVPFSSYAEAVACVTDTVTSKRKSSWVAANPQKIYRAMHDHELRTILEHADVCTCDGVGVSIACRLLRGRRLARCTGCDLFFELLAVAAQKGWRVFLLGASQEVNDLACRRLQQRYPDLSIAGRQDGYFQDSSAVVRQINDSQADLLFVGMGSPKQERWIFEHRHEIEAPFCMGVGGSLNVASGLIKRAPLLLRKMGLEFAYQAATEPRRLKRQAVYLPYMLMVLREKVLRSECSSVGGTVFKTPRAEDRPRERRGVIPGASQAAVARDPQQREIGSRHKESQALCK